MSIKTVVSHQETLKTLIGFLKEVMGEFGAEMDITMETSFSADLELESIEFVHLAEVMQEHYGDHLNFADWLSQKNIEDINSLTVGNVVEFINENLTFASKE